MDIPEHRRAGRSSKRFAVYTGPAGVEGYAVYRQKEKWDEFPEGEVQVLEVMAATPEAHEATEHSYYSLNTLLDKEAPKGRWSEGPSFDGRGEFSVRNQPAPEGQEPKLGPAKPHSGAQEEQINPPK